MILAASSPCSNFPHQSQVTVADLEGMDNLSLLYLHDNAITDLGTSLKALKSLTMLDISSNKLTKVIASLQMFKFDRKIPVLLHASAISAGPGLSP